MNLKTPVKQALRIGGHALAITVHDRLNTLEQDVAALKAQLEQLTAQSTSEAESQEALLQASIHIVEALQKFQETSNQHAATQHTGLERIEALRHEVKEQADNIMRHIDSARASLQSCTSAISDLRTAQNHILSVLDEELVHQVSVESNEYAFTNPEIGLMQFLYSYLPSRIAIDIGAHVGDVSRSLLESGYEVYAFEPFPPVYEKLVDSLGQKNHFHPFNFAVGRVETEMPLHIAEDRSAQHTYNDATVFSSLIEHSMPDDLPFTRTVPVSVKTLASLHESGVLPAGVGLLKIDTEGFDMEVIRGMGEHRYPVIGTEFWDTSIPFGQSGLLYTLDSMVQELQQLGYHWHIVLYRVWGRNQTAFYCNHPRAIPNSWGNAFFFRDFSLFSEGQKWCSAVLPRAYFKPAATE